jgi:uncharacterized protein YrzB (UPF0473 family)
MDANTIFTKIITFQKENFEKTYAYFVKIQDQVEQKATTFIQGTEFVPEPVKDFYKQWAETAKNSREALKKYADERYQGIENYLATKA